MGDDLPRGSGGFCSVRDQRGASCPLSLLGLARSAREDAAGICHGLGRMVNDLTMPSLYSLCPTPLHPSFPLSSLPISCPPPPLVPPFPSLLPLLSLPSSSPLLRSPSLLSPVFLSFPSSLSRFRTPLPSLSLLLLSMTHRLSPPPPLLFHPPPLRPCCVCSSFVSPIPSPPHPPIRRVRCRPPPPPPPIPLFPPLALLPLLPPYCPPPPPLNYTLQGYHPRALCLMPVSPTTCPR